MSKWIQDPDMLEPSLIEVDDWYDPQPMTPDEARFLRCVAWIIFIIEGIYVIVFDIKKFGW